MTLTRRLFAIAFLTIFALLPFAQSFQAASDDITGNTHEAALREMIAKDIMRGYGDGIYKPHDLVSRGQFSAIIARALNLEPGTDASYFKDVTERTGVMSEILAAANAGLITGYPKEGLFKPDEKITRQHMAVIVKRAIDYLQMEEKAEVKAFADIDSIMPDYRPAVYSNVAYGIFKGSPINGQTYFRPNDFANRGEAAAVMSRLLLAAEGYNGDTATTFNTATIDAAGTQTVLRKYTTFDAAETAFKNGQGDAIVYKGSIIQMHSGIVVSTPTTASSLTNIYLQADLTKPFTYVAADTELEYVGSTATHVKVRVAGKEGYIKHENATFKTPEMITGRSYYASVSGDLRHYIYLNQSNKYVSYSTGKAPAFMTPGTRYYSWNGVDFTTAGGVKAGSGYNYFQFLSARSASSYTAAEIDAYILKTLKELEAANPTSSKYKDASTRSKLIGMGAHLKKVEAEKKVNALMILALAQHESDYGLSTRALTYNNLFGLRVYDDNPANDHFASVAENVDELLNLFWNKNYIPPNALYANGSVFGSKSLGMNMSYASDPYWGAKAAGHWYRIDKAMGSRDFGKYSLGMTTSTSQNARTTASTANTPAFTYAKAGMPVILLEKQQGTDRVWYKTSSDHIGYPSVYFAGEYIRVLPVLK